MSNHSETIIVPSDQVSPHQTQGFFSPDMNMVLLTWVTFFLLLAVLYKYAWKPILSILDAREESIRKSLENADRIKNELESLDAKCSQLIADAESKATQVIDQSRKAAKEAANIIQNKAHIEKIKIGQRNDKAIIYGFRKRFNTILKIGSDVNSNVAEKLMAHKNGLDGVYFKPTREQCFEEFVKAIPRLTVSESERLRVKLQKSESEKDQKIAKLESDMKAVYKLLSKTKI